MALWKPDPAFYPSPRDAASAPPESLAYVAAFDRAAGKPGFRGLRPHQTRLQGGHASSDSYCHP